MPDALDRFRTDYQGRFIRTSGRDGTYQRKAGGAGIPLRAILADQYSVAETPSPGVQSGEFTLRFSEADLPNPRHGDSWTQAGAVWFVIEQIEVASARTGQTVCRVSRDSPG
jgi:hypothetical protein